MTISVLILLPSLQAIIVWINIKNHIGCYGLALSIFCSILGPVTSNVVEGGAFWYADKEQSKPDLQFHFLVGAGAEEGYPSVPAGSSGITLNSYTLRPKARGSVKLSSANPSDAPLVDPNYLGHPDDLKTSAEGVKISVEMFRQSSLQNYIKAIRFPDETVKPRSSMKTMPDNMAVLHTTRWAHAR